MSPVTQATDRWVQIADGPTRDELYVRAQELDIKGRTNMSKDELAAAIAEHES